MLISSARQEHYITRFHELFPFVYTKILTKTAYGRPIYALQVGKGCHKVLVTAGHHANEYITSELLYKMLGCFCTAVRSGGCFGGKNAGWLFENCSLYAVPMVNPDGIDLVVGAIAKDSAEYRAAEKIAENYPKIPFPGGWKANLRGVDLNLNYPAGFDRAVAVKESLGYFAPSPRDYPGKKPLDQPETAALAGYTTCVHPDLVLAYHTQGEVIYADYQGIFAPGTLTLANAFTALSGYRLEKVPPDSSNAGYKDWYIDRFCRPGFTIEAGCGENPLPEEQLEPMLQKNIPLLAAAMAR